jgi:hypothetical protein
MADNLAKQSRGISTGGLIGGVTAVATAIAAIVGMLNQLGYIGNHDVAKPVAASVSEPLPALAPPQTAGSSADAPASSATLAMLEPKLSSLTGAWRDAGMGACHLITQKGNDLAITNYYPNSQDILSHGDGTVAGEHVELRLVTARGEFRLSPDGRVMRGTMTRSSGDRPSMWQYIGPTCEHPG